jgi:hypothetical protein
MSIEAIQRVVWTYLDGLYEGDTAKIAASFHAAAHLHSGEGGALKAEPRDQWIERVKTRPSPKSLGHPRTDRIVSIDMADDKTAFVKCECAVPPRYFTDYLTLIELSEGWRIVTKTFRFGTRE